MKLNFCIILTLVFPLFPHNVCSPYETTPFHTCNRRSQSTRARRPPRVTSYNVPCLPCGVGPPALSGSSAPFHCTRYTRDLRRPFHLETFMFTKWGHSYFLCVQNTEGAEAAECNLTTNLQCVRYKHLRFLAWSIWSVLKSVGGLW